MHWLFVLSCLLSVSGFDITVTHHNLTGDEIRRVVWIDSTSLLVHTVQNRVYFSLDQGATFTDLQSVQKDPLMGRNFVLADSCPPPHGCITDVAVAKEGHADRVFLMGMNDTWVFTSKFELIIRHKDRFIVDIRFHPKSSQFVLAGSCQDDCPEMTLLLSKDRGMSFSPIKTSSSGPLMAYATSGSMLAMWGAPAADNFEDATLFVMVNNPLAPNHRHPYDLITFNYDTQKSQLIAPQAAFFTVASDFLFVAVVDKQTEAVHLRTSKENAKNVRQILLPHPLTQLSYTVLDSSEGALFLNILHGDPDNCGRAPWGTTYVSDSSGSRFRISLVRNRRASGRVDFKKLNGLDGVLIANQISPDDISIRCRVCRTSTECFDACKFTTRISFDKGNSWVPLVLPAGHPACYDERNNSLSCTLHLHGTSSMMADIPPTAQQAILTSAHAPGMIIASGNTGEELLPYSDGAYIFLSRDAGQSWRRIAIGHHLYTFMDNGGIIILVPALRPSTDLLISLDEGNTFHTYVLRLQDSALNGQVIFTAIKTNPSNVRSRHLMLMARTQTGGIASDVIISVDLNAFLQKQAVCQGLDQPDDDDSDYESWNPNRNCLLGRVITYVRKKSGHDCWDPKGLEERNQLNRSQVKICDCERSTDYECDFGYTLSADGSSCERDDSVPVPTDDLICNLKTRQMRKTQGYMLIPGDVCKNDQWGVQTRTCGRPSRGRRAIMFLTLVAFGAFLAFACWNCYTSSTACRESVDGVVEKVRGSAGSIKYRVVPQYRDFGDDENDEGQESDEDAQELTLDEPPPAGPNGTGGRAASSSHGPPGLFSRAVVQLPDAADMSLEETEGVFVVAPTPSGQNVGATAPASIAPASIAPTPPPLMPLRPRLTPPPQPASNAGMPSSSDLPSSPELQLKAVVDDSDHKSAAPFDGLFI